MLSNDHLRTFEGRAIFTTHYPVFHSPMGRDFSFKFLGVARDQNVEQIRAENNNNSNSRNETHEKSSING